MMNEASQPSGGGGSRTPRFIWAAAARCRLCAPPLQHGVSMRERVRTRRYRCRRRAPPQGHSRYDEDHSRKEWKVFCIYVILYFMPLMEKHVPLILCRNSQFQQILNMYGF
jgi:hypothetical protein